MTTMHDLMTEVNAAECVLKVMEDQAESGWAAELALPHNPERGEYRRRLLVNAPGCWHGYGRDRERTWQRGYQYRDCVQDVDGWCDTEVTRLEALDAIEAAIAAGKVRA
jgi:hypothetical protein